MKIYFLIAFLIMLPFFSQGYVLLLDLQVGPHSFSNFDDFYGYSTNPYGATLPFRMVFFALSDFISLELLGKLLLFLTLFFCGFFMHESLPKEYGNARYFGGLFYMLNPFVLIRFLAGHWTILLSYAIFPFAIKNFLDFIKSPNKKGLIRVITITFFASVSIHGLLLLIFAYFIIFIFHFKIHLIKEVFSIGIILIILNLFWIVPALLLFDYSLSNADNYIEDFGSKGSFEIASLQGFWLENFNPSKEFSEIWILAFFFVFSLSAIGFQKLYIEDRNLAISLFIIFVLAFFLAGNGFAFLGPFKDVVSFVFRDSHKFTALIAFVYSFFGSFAVYKLPKIHTLLLLSIPLFFIPGFFGQIGPTSYPEDWNHAEILMSTDSIPGNLLIIPPHGYSNFSWINGKKNAGSGVYDFFSRPKTISKNIETKNIHNDRIDPSFKYFNYIFENRQFINNTADYLLPLNVRYIILFKNDEETPHYLYLFYRFNGVQNIDLLYESDSLYLFRNNLVQSQMYSYSGNKTGSVVTEEIHPARFRIIDSEYDRVVFAKIGRMDLNGKLIPQSNVFSEFQFSRGILKNTLFELILILFLLSFLLLFLFFGNSWLITSLLFFIFFLLINNGFVSPKEIGWLIILLVLFRGSFLNVKTT